MSTISTGAYLKGLFAASKALGDPAISSNATMEIEGHEELYLQIKQFPWPELSPGGEIEVPLPVGSARWVPQQLKTHQQGQITFIETQQGHIQAMLEDLIAQGGRFNAKVYEGTPDNYTRMLELRDCFLQLDPIDRDMENRGQVVLISGTLFYHHFGNQ